MAPLIASLRARGVSVPMQRALRTGGGAVSHAPLALLDLTCEDGTQGCAYVFCYTDVALGATVRLLADLAPVLIGQPAAPRCLHALLHARFRLVGAQGLTGLAMAAVDIAAWDLIAKRAALPLVELLGGTREAIPAYNSNGLGLRDDGVAALADEARSLAEGFNGIKLRLGYASADDDLRAVEAVRRAVGDAVAVMCDYNQCLDAVEAQHRARHLGQTGLTWIEEPVRADDYESAAHVRAASAIPIQLGENAWGPDDVHRSLRAGASDYYMPDAGKIGGVTGWIEAASQCAAFGVPVSSHLYPELSVHLLGATRGRHWLEYVDWASAILSEPLALDGGTATPPHRPGHGMSWDEEAIARFGPRDVR